MNSTTIRRESTTVIETRTTSMASIMTSSTRSILPSTTTFRTTTSAKRPTTRIPRMTITRSRTVSITFIPTQSFQPPVRPESTLSPVTKVVRDPETTPTTVTQNGTENQSQMQLLWILLPVFALLVAGCLFYKKRKSKHFDTTSIHSRDTEVADERPSSVVPAPIEIPRKRRPSGIRIDLSSLSPSYTNSVEPASPHSFVDANNAIAEEAMFYIESSSVDELPQKLVINVGVEKAEGKLTPTQQTVLQWLHGASLESSPDSLFSFESSDTEPDLTESDTDTELDCTSESDGSVPIQKNRVTSTNIVRLSNPDPEFGTRDTLPRDSFAFTDYEQAMKEFKNLKSVAAVTLPMDEKIHLERIQVHDLKRSRKTSESSIETTGSPLTTPIGGITLVNRNEIEYIVVERAVSIQLKESIDSFHTAQTESNQSFQTALSDHSGSESFYTAPEAESYFTASDKRSSLKSMASRASKRSSRSSRYSVHSVDPVKMKQEMVRGLLKRLKNHPFL